MPEPAPSPFLAIPSAGWVCANALAFAIYDRFPVSLARVLVMDSRQGIVPLIHTTLAESRIVVAPDIDTEREHLPVVLILGKG